MSSNSPRGGHGRRDYRLGFHGTGRPGETSGLAAAQVCNDARPSRRGGRQRLRLQDSGPMPMSTSEQRAAELRRAALDYHQFPTPGKVAIAATKQLVNQHDLALAYSPGVAAACEGDRRRSGQRLSLHLARQPRRRHHQRHGGVLGLGDIGPLAAKPVMEGKGVLFKKFAGIDVFDIEVAEKNLDKLIDLIAALEPTFGGIKPRGHQGARLLLRRARAALAVADEHPGVPRRPARHCDRRWRGDVLNALKVSGKKIDEVKLVTSGAGAGGAGVPRPLGEDRHSAREQSGSLTWPASSTKARTELMDDDKAGVRARHAASLVGRRDRPAPTSSSAFSAAGRAQARHGGEDAAEPGDLRARQPDAGDPARRGARGAQRRHCRHRAAPTIRTRSTTFSAFPTSFAARSTPARRRSRSRWRSPRSTPSPGWRRPSRAEVVTAAYAGATLSFGPEYLIPKPFDPRLMNAHRAGSGAGRGRLRRGGAARLPTWTRTATSCRPSSMPRARRCGRSSRWPRTRAQRSGSPSPKAKRSACCARRCRSWSTRTWRGRP